MPIPAHPRDDVRYPVTERFRLAKRVFEDLAVLENSFLREVHLPRTASKCQLRPRRLLGRA